MTNYQLSRDNGVNGMLLDELHRLGGNIRYTIVDNDTAYVCCEHPLSKHEELCLILKWPGQLRPYSELLYEYDSSFWDGEQRPDGSRWKSTTSGEWVKVYPRNS